jgi:hypothetical protein
MITEPIEFQFKGSREYIHGTDIFNRMLVLKGPIRELSKIRFFVHSFVCTPICNLYLADAKDGLIGVADLKVRCQYEVNGVMHWIGMAEGSGDTTSGGRYEYDEEKIITLCQMEGQGIFLTCHSAFSFIETVVAMNKHMHQQMFPGITGNWVFTRIDLDAGCEAQDKIALRFVHNMNYQLTKSDILVDGNKVGDLYFSLVKS